MDGKLNDARGGYYVDPRRLGALIWDLTHKGGINLEYNSIPDAKALLELDGQETDSDPPDDAYLRNG